MITKQDAEQAAKQGKVEAIKISILHHKDPEKMTSLELQVAWKEDKFNLSAEFCDLCQKHNQGADRCTGCVLKDNGCGNGLWHNASIAFGEFIKNPSNANYDAFLKAEAAMVTRPEVELAKAEAEEDKTRKCKDCKYKPDKSPCHICVGGEKFEPKAKAEVELRHGELRLFRKIESMKKDLPIIVDLSKEKPRILFIDDVNGESSHVSYTRKEFFRLSDHISYPLDDLKAEGEPLESFEVKSKLDRHVTFKIDGDNISMCACGIWHTFPLSGDGAIIGHKLIRMARTVEKKAKNAK